MNPVSQQQNAAEEEITISKTLYYSLMDDSIELKERKEAVSKPESKSLTREEKSGLISTYFAGCSFSAFLLSLLIGPQEATLPSILKVFFGTFLLGLAFSLVIYFCSACIAIEYRSRFAKYVFIFAVPAILSVPFFIFNLGL